MEARKQREPEPEQWRALFDQEKALTLAGVVDQATQFFFSPTVINRGYFLCIPGLPIQKYLRQCFVFPIHPTRVKREINSSLVFFTSAL